MVHFLIGLGLGVGLGFVLAALLAHTDLNDYKDWEGEE